MPDNQERMAMMGCSHAAGAEACANGREGEPESDCCKSESDCCKQESDCREEQPEPNFPDACFRQKRKHGKYREIENLAVPVIEGTLFDTHCHPQLTPDPAAALAKAAMWGVTRLACVVDLAEDGQQTIMAYEGWLQQAQELIGPFAESVGKDPSACTLPDIRFIVGCHPHNTSRQTPEIESLMRAWLQHPSVCAIGESGLDFFYNISPQDVQVDAFRRQIRMAHELNVPMCLHIRDAHALALRILEEEGFPQAGCVLHCFNLDADTLRPWLEHDCYVGFDGPLTFKNNEATREAALLVRPERLLVETDAPFMTPEPMRGMLCGPHHVLWTADCLARVRGVEGESARQAFFAQLQENGLRLYGKFAR